MRVEQLGDSPMNSNALRRTLATTLAAVLALPNLPMKAQTHIVREGTCTGAQELFPDNNPGPGSLKALRPLEIPDLGRYVRDREAAVALGKALFWDMQVGSDGIQACASCHFRAGADPAFDQSSQPGRPAQPRPDPSPGAQQATEHRGLPAAQARRSDVPRVARAQGQRRCHLLAGDQAGADRGRHARRHQRLRLQRLRPGVQSPRTEHPTRRAAQHADGDQCGVQPRPVLGRACRDPVQWRQSAGCARSWRARVARRRLRSARAGPASHRQCRTRVAGGRSAVERPRNGIPRPHVLRRRQATRLGQAAGPAEGPPAGQRARALGRPRPCRQQRTGRHLPPPDRGRVSAGMVAIEPGRGQAGGRARDVHGDPPSRAARQRVHDARVQLLVVLRPRDPVVRDDPGVGRLPRRPPLRRCAGFPSRSSSCAAWRSSPAMPHVRPATLAPRPPTTRTASSRVRWVDGVQQPSEFVERMFNGNCEVVAYDQSYYNIGVRPVAGGSGHRGPGSVRQPARLDRCPDRAPGPGAEC